MNASVWELIRRFPQRLVGSSFYNDPLRPPNDVDVVVCVPDVDSAARLGEQLIMLGFKKSVPLEHETDYNLVSAYKLGWLDVQIATPDGFAKKVNAVDWIKSSKFYLGVQKREIYLAYNKGRDS